MIESHDSSEEQPSGEHLRSLQETVPESPGDLQACLQSIVDEIQRYGPNSQILLWLVEGLRERVYHLYDDPSREGNPTQEVFPFLLAVHQLLVEEHGSHVTRARRSTARFIIKVIGSWEEKSDWERDVQVLLEEQRQEEEAF